MTKLLPKFGGFLFCGYSVYTLGSITFSFMDQSIPSFMTQRGRGVVDKLLFRFSICGSVPEIFAIKVESCQKSRIIWDDFWPSEIFFWGGGGRLSKIVPSLSLLPCGTSTEKSFVRILPVVRKLLSLTR